MITKTWICLSCKKISVYSAEFINGVGLLASHSRVSPECKHYEQRLAHPTKHAPIMVDPALTAKFTFVPDPEFPEFTAPVFPEDHPENICAVASAHPS